MPDQSLDPRLIPSYPVWNRMGRLLWSIGYMCLYRPSPRFLHAWRATVLRLFGAKIGPNCHFYPRAKIWAPWNLECGDTVAVGDEAEIYNPSKLFLGSHVSISQGAYICGATHDYDRRDFQLISYQMYIGRYAWICARATVLPGINVGEAAILGLGSIATHHLAPFGVYAGIPARKIKERAGDAIPSE